MEGRRYGEAWREEARLKDGRRVVLRLLRADDAPLLKEGFERLSPESRYRRFHAARTSLSEAEVEYLTRLDGEDHLAVGALDADTGEGLGVARCIRLAEDREKVEAAVAVIDEAQGKGLGRLLLDRLAMAAAERGVKHIRCSVLAGNQPMLALLKKLAPEGVEVREGEVVTVDVPLPQDLVESGGVPSEHPLYRLLIDAAAGVLVFVHTTAELRDWLLARVPKR